MKRGFNIAANVCALVLMGVLLIGAILSCANLLELESSSEVMIAWRIFIVLIVFIVGAIIISALALALGNKSNSNGLKVTVIVFMVIVGVLEFIGNGYIWCALCLIPILLEAIAILLKEKPVAVAEPTEKQVDKAPITTEATEAEETETETEDTAPKGRTVDEKVAELKHLKETEVISEEQYNEAITAIIEDLKK